MVGVTNDDIDSAAMVASVHVEYKFSVCLDELPYYNEDYNLSGFLCNNNLNESGIFDYLPLDYSGSINHDDLTKYKEFFQDECGFIAEFDNPDELFMKRGGRNTPEGLYTIKNIIKKTGVSRLGEEERIAEVELVDSDGKTLYWTMYISIGYSADDCYVWLWETDTDILDSIQGAFSFPEGVECCYRDDLNSWFNSINLLPFAVRFLFCVLTYFSDRIINNCIGKQLKQIKDMCRNAYYNFVKKLAADL